MENTWASGAIELLRHADSHIHLDSAFDRRIAFISIDNAVETMIRTFLSLPASKSNVKVPWKELGEAENSFPKLLSLLWSHASTKLIGIDDSDIEHYHRIRNKLYHDGTGLSVDSQYLQAYRLIASLLLKNLFGITPEPVKPAPTLERLIELWNLLEETMKQRLQVSGINKGHTYYWEEAMRQRIVSLEDVTSFTELRMIRNKQVHSTNLDKDQIHYAVSLAEKLLKQISPTP